MDLNNIIKMLYEKEADLEVEKALSISLEEFWSENRNYAEEPLTISPLAKKLFIGVTAFLAVILITYIGVISTNKITKARQQENLYQLALSEIKTDSYAAAISHFKAIEPNNKHYYDAKGYIHKLTNVERYLTQAQEFYDKDELAYALEKVNSIYILINKSEPAEELKKKILSRMELKKVEADRYISEGLELIKNGDCLEAKKKLDLSEHLYPNYSNALKLKTALDAEATNLSNEANTLYNSFKIDEATSLNKLALDLKPDLKTSLELEEKITSYQEGVTLAEKASSLMLQRKYENAKAVMDSAVEKNPFISTEYSELIAQIKDIEKIIVEVNAFKEKIKITDATFINSGTEDLPQLTVMFCIENTTDEIKEFNAYWCTLMNKDVELMPTPYSTEQMSIVAKVNADGKTEAELENDYFYMKKGEKYKILLNFEGSKESLKDSILYYCDYNLETPLKVDFAIVE